jgi:hypothetical protein
MQSIPARSGGVLSVIITHLSLQTLPQLHHTSSAATWLNSDRPSRCHLPLNNNKLPDGTRATSPNLLNRIPPLTHSNHIRIDHYITAYLQNPLQFCMEQKQSLTSCLVVVSTDIQPVILAFWVLEWCGSLPDWFLPVEWRWTAEDYICLPSCCTTLTYLTGNGESTSYFFIIKPTRCTNFTRLFWHENLHVSDCSSVHHQEFIYCTLSNGMCHTGL